MANDTAPEALARYAALLRARSPAERLAIAAGLTSAVRSLAEAGIRRQHPGAAEAEVRWRLAARLYGPETACRLFGALAHDHP